MIRKPEIRFAETDDIESLVHLCKLHADFEKSEYDPLGKARELNRHLFCENPALYCLVVERNEEIIGYSTYMKHFSTWDACFYVYMDCLFLNEKSRGFGIGERLIDRIKQEAEKLDCILIQWQTPDFNTRAIKFYNRIGGVSKTKERYFLTL